MAAFRSKSRLIHAPTSEFALYLTALHCFPALLYPEIRNSLSLNHQSLLFVSCHAVHNFNRCLRPEPTFDYPVLMLHYQIYG